MRLYYADIRGLDESKALYPPLSPSQGSAFGVSLLSVAYQDYAEATMPFIKKLIRGKPYFPANPGVNFSISHSRTHVICALSKYPVGVDTIDFRSVSPRVIEKLTTPEERKLLSFYDIWALRESLYKLEGEGDLRTMRFYCNADGIIAPIEGVRCRLYKELDNSSTAVSIREGDFPEKLIKIPSEQLLKQENRLTRMMDKNGLQ